MKAVKWWVVLLISAMMAGRVVPASEESSESSDSSDSSATDEGSSSSSESKIVAPYEVNLKCNRGFLNAYGIDGVNDAHMHGMALCEDVKYSCCSPIDELKFHKNWFGYYQVKLLETHKRMVDKYKRLAEILETFKALPVKDHKPVIKNGRFKEAEEVHALLSKGGIDPELHPVLDELENLQKKDLNDKKGVFCMFCNYDNHEFFGLSGGTVLINQKSCQELIADSGLMLQIRNKLLQPLIMLVHKLLGLYAVDYFDPVEWDLIRDARLHMDLVNMCFPTENAEFVLEKCISICDRYNLVENSEIIFGEFELYSYLIARVEQFEEWLPKALEDPKKHTKQWVKAEEVEEEDDKAEAEGQGEGEGQGEEAAAEEAETAENIPSRVLTSTKGGRQTSRLRREREERTQLVRENRERILALKGLRKMAKRKRKRLKWERQKRRSEDEDQVLTDKILSVERKIRNYKHAIREMKHSNKKLKRTISKSKRTISSQINRSLKKEKEFFADPIETRKLGFGGRPDSLSQARGRPRKRRRRSKQTAKFSKHKGRRDRGLETASPKAEEETQQDDGDDSLIYADPATLEQKNENCMNCSSSIGSAESADVADSEFIFRSRKITNSKFLEDSENCTDCAHGIGLKNCLNVTHSNFTEDSEHVTGSLNVTNSTHVKNSTFVANSTKVEDSTKIFDSSGVKQSSNCRDCHNCFNCTNCRNVTNCSNCFNVTDSVNVTNAEHSSKLFNATDIAHGYNLTNATNMTNASSCANCSSRENCTGKACNEPVKSEFEIALENKLYYSTMEIVERLYGMTTLGDVDSYLGHPDEFDPFLYRANNLLYDLSRYRSIFDEDGIILDFRTTEDFTKSKKVVVEAAVKHFMKSNQDYLDDGVRTGLVDAEEDGFDVRIADLVNRDSDFLSVHNFLRDARTGVISYQALQGKNDLEMEAYDEYLEVIGHEEGGGIVECEEGAGGFEDCLKKRRMVEQVLKEKQMEKMREELEKKEEEAGDEEEAEEDEANQDD